MEKNKCKKCRRLGEKLFLRGEKCYTPKCVLSRKPYAPGAQGKRTGKRRSRRGLSEYGLQLRCKQKVKFLYGIRERQFKNYVTEAQRKKGGDIPQRLLGLLESRLDNSVFRLGFSESRSKARQTVLHGHIAVNNRKVNIPSYRLKIGDKLLIRPQSLSKGLFKDLDVKLKKYKAPAWLKLDKNKKEAEIILKPTTDDESIVESLDSIIGFYSR